MNGGVCGCEEVRKKDKPERRNEKTSDRSCDEVGGIETKQASKTNTRIRGGKRAAASTRTLSRFAGNSDGERFLRRLGVGGRRRRWRLVVVVVICGSRCRRRWNHFGHCCRCWRRSRSRCRRQGGQRRHRWRRD